MYNLLTEEINIVSGGLWQIKCYNNKHQVLDEITALLENTATHFILGCCVDDINNLYQIKGEPLENCKEPISAVYGLSSKKNHPRNSQFFPISKSLYHTI